jgi:hypothetical protein
MRPDGSFLVRSQSRIGAKIMSEKESFADKVRDQAIDDDSPRAHQAPDRSRWADFLRHRWPTALGIAVAALTAYDLEIGAESVSSLSALVVLMALVYVGAAALDRRRASWVVFLTGFAVMVVFLDLLDSGIEPSAVLLVAALVFVVLGVARGLLRRPGGLTLQAAGMLGFGATALAALYVDPDLGGYLVAFAHLGHAAWDAYHYLRDRVVARSYAEYCGVLDLLVGWAILVMV